MSLAYRLLPIATFASAFCLSGASCGYAIAATVDAFDEIAPTYTTIRWADPLNPAFVPLGSGEFLLATQTGIQHWDAKRNIFSPVPDWPAPPGVLYGAWLRAGENTLFAAGDRAGPNSLLLWSLKARKVTASFELPADLRPRALIAIGDEHALVCGFDTASFVVQLESAQLQRVSSQSDPIRSGLERASVAGPVEGFGEIPEPRDANGRPSPVRFDTAECEWKVSNPPAFFGKSLEVKPFRLSDGRWLIGLASWQDPATGYWEKLETPLVWNAQTAGWDTLQRLTERGGEPRAVRAFGPDDAIASAMAPDPSLVEFFDRETLSWQRSRQRLPDAVHAMLAPLDDSTVLAFLAGDRNNAGAVVKMEPMQQPTPGGRLAFDHDNFGAVDLGKSSSMLLGKRVEIIREGLPTEVIEPPARPIATASGVALDDDSVLVFGGLPEGCRPDYLSQCDKGERPMSSFLWQWSRGVWVELAELKIPFTVGAWWDSGNSGIAPRADALVRENGDFVYLTNGLIKWHEGDEPLPPTQLYRWRLDKAPEVLAPLRLSRERPTLLELADGRLAVIGGTAQRDLIAFEKDCLDCQDSFAIRGPFEETASTEIFDENLKTWVPAAPAYYPGGRAVRLANGRVFKLALRGYTSEEGYQAEIADPGITRWTRTPPFPLREEKTSVWQLVAVGNRAVIVMERPADRLVVWEDDKQQWQILKPWKGVTWSADKPLFSVSPAGNDRVLLRYANSYEYSALPERQAGGADSPGWLDVSAFAHAVAAIANLPRGDYDCYVEGEEDTEGPYFLTFEEERQAAEAVRQSERYLAECNARGQSESFTYKTALDEFNANWLPVLKLAADLEDPVAEVILRLCESAPMLDRTGIASDCSERKEDQEFARARLEAIAFKPALHRYVIADVYRRSQRVCDAGDDVAKKRCRVEAELDRFRGIQGLMNTGYLGVVQSLNNCMVKSDNQELDRLIQECQRQSITSIAATERAPRAYADQLSIMGACYFPGPRHLSFHLDGLIRSSGWSLFDVPDPDFRSKLDKEINQLVAAIESSIDNDLRRDPRWALFLAERSGKRAFGPSCASQ